MTLDVSREACPSPYSLANKIGRVLWACVWWLFFRPSPRIFFAYRTALLKIFGAKLEWSSRVDPTTRIWAPWNLSMGENASIGAHADCYNSALIRIDDAATVSQYVYLCSASHDISDPNMKLIRSPITVEAQAWVCAKAYIGPGVIVGEGAVVGACAVVPKTIAPWSIVVGNPAKEIGRRELDAHSK